MFGNRLERQVKKELMLEEPRPRRQVRLPRVKMPRVRVRVTRKHAKGAYALGKGVYRVLQHPEKYFHL
jgi:hypothetical protein